MMIKVSIQLVLALLLSTSVFGQTLSEKIGYILTADGSADHIKTWIYTKHINPLKLSLPEQDLQEVKKIESELTDDKILNMLTPMFLKNYTEQEVNEIYKFLQSSGGQKYFGTREHLVGPFKESFTTIIQNLGDIQRRFSNSESPSIAKPVYSSNKEDGFYKVINYDKEYDISKFILEDTASLTLQDVQEAKLLYLESTFNHQPIIELKLTPEGKQKFAKVTLENIGKPIAIVINKIILSAPIIQSEIAGGEVQVTGNLTSQEAQNIVNKIGGK